jgi:hypothetical protein
MQTVLEIVGRDGFIENGWALVHFTIVYGLV